MTLTRLDIHLTEDQIRKTLVGDATRGLLGSIKVLPSKYLYDQRGCDLFQQITALPEYYHPNRIERRILAERGAQIVRDAPMFSSLVELGSGSSATTSLLLDPLMQMCTRASYVPVDVSICALATAIGQLRESYPALVIHGVVRDFEQPLINLPQHGRRMVALLGGTIGNLDKMHRAKFFDNIATALGPGESFLLGIDLVKDRMRAVSAHDDASGVTAQFNLNILTVLNRLLAASFEPTRFRHVAIWNAEQSRVEMRLRAREAMKVRLDALRTTLALEEGEDILTGVSTKFERGGLECELNRAGFNLTGWWAGSESCAAGDEDYAVALAVRSRRMDS